MNKNQRFYIDHGKHFPLDQTPGLKLTDLDNHTMCIEDTLTHPKTATGTTPNYGILVRTLAVYMEIH